MLKGFIRYKDGQVDCIDHVDEIHYNHNNREKIEIAFEQSTLNKGRSVQIDSIAEFEFKNDTLKQIVTASAKTSKTGKFIQKNISQEELATIIALRLSVSRTGYDYRNIANNIAERILELYILKRKE